MMRTLLTWAALAAVAWLAVLVILLAVRTITAPMLQLLEVLT